MKTEAHYGAKIHEVLNQTLLRKLTLKEYSSIVKNTQNLLQASRENQKQILFDVLEKLKD